MHGRMMKYQARSNPHAHIPHICVVNAQCMRKCYMTRPSDLLWCVVITKLKQIGTIYNVRVLGVSTVFLSRICLVVKSNINRQLSIYWIDVNTKSALQGYLLIS